MKTRKSGGQVEKSTVPDVYNDFDWQSRVAAAAYYKAESRGFAPGKELDDWLSAEAELKEWTDTQMEAESC